MYLIDYSKPLDKWIDDNTESIDVGSGGVFNGVECSEVEQKITLIIDALSDAVSALKCIEQEHGRMYGIGFDRVYAKAEAAGLKK